MHLSSEAPWRGEAEEKLGVKHLRPGSGGKIRPAHLIRIPARGVAYVMDGLRSSALGSLSRVRAGTELGKIRTSPATQLCRRIFLTTFS